MLDWSAGERQRHSYYSVFIEPRQLRHSHGPLLLVLVQISLGNLLPNPKGGRSRLDAVQPRCILQPRPNSINRQPTRHTRREEMPDPPRSSRHLVSRIWCSSQLILPLVLLCLGLGDRSNDQHGMVCSLHDYTPLHRSLMAPLVCCIMLSITSKPLSFPMLHLARSIDCIL